ncbi:hypothetical protein C2845_PM15G19100 [Panicum miliaceum]|uniref:CCHC-type domain-containing protein n=1 Tax=Panicum miliaceum TaxID=4540 RepID=A0A3L6QDB4_PANMI|nr:hypothetical protein C2845_PM15G19100 [Panicum miliaceum]
MRSDSEIAFVIDERYRKMTCYNCGKPGHFVGNCEKPKVCFICNVPGHHMSACPQWNSPHPMAAYMGSASLGLGFYHIDTPESKNIQWLNLKNCGVVRVIEREVTLAELEKELSDMLCKEWPWQIRELEAGKFLVRFPPHKRVDDIKNYPSFNMRKRGVRVEVLEWVGSLEPFSELKEAWVQIRGVPPKWCAWKVFAQMTSGFGMMVEVDWSSLFKSFYEMVRVKIACRNPSKVPKERLYEMNKQLYLVSFTMEDVEQDPPITGHANDGDGPDDEDDDDADDLDPENKDNLDMDLDGNRSESVLPKSANLNRKGNDTPRQGSKTVPVVEVPVMIAQDCLNENNDNIDQESQIRFIMSTSEGEMDKAAVHTENCLDGSSEQHSKWLAFKEKIVEEEVSASECSQFLRNMELVDSEEEEELENTEDMVPMQNLEMLGRNLLHDFEDCQEETEAVPQLSSDKPPEENVSKPKRKQQWGPILREERPRRHADDGKSMLQRAEELVKYNYLEMDYKNKKGTGLDGREDGDTQSSRNAEKMELFVQGSGRVATRRVRAKTGDKGKTSPADRLDHVGFAGCAGLELGGDNRFIRLWRGNSV